MIFSEFLDNKIRLYNDFKKVWPSIPDLLYNVMR